MTTASPTRVVLVCEATGGGVGRHVLDVAEHLPQRGFDVLVVHSTRRAEDAFVSRLSRHAEFGYRIAHVNVDRAPGPRDALGAWQLRRAIRVNGGADVLHGHSAKGGALARLARWGCARRVFYTPHAFYAQAPSLSSTARMLYSVAEYSLAFATDRVIATSTEEARLARTLGIPERKLTVVENGIVLRTDAQLARARSSARRALGIEAHDVVVGFVGRLVPQKAPARAVEVFRRLSADGERVRFLLAGDGPEAAGVERALSAAGMQACVQWLRRAAGAAIMPALDVLLVTSDYEGFPYVMLEALDAGCAIVTTVVGGARDCVVDGRNGKLVESRDPATLAAAVRELIADPERLAMARLVSRTQATRFELNRMLDRLASLYRSEDRDVA